MTPCVRLFSETVWVERGDGLASEFSAIEAPVLELSFDYGGVCVRSSEPQHRIYSSGQGGIECVERDRQTEARAQYVLESFGAVEIGCLPDHAVAPGSRAEYLVQLDGDVNALCSFSAYVLPQLENLGWRIDVAGDYPYRVVACDPPWYATVAQDERPDWFGLELGVAVDGQRIDLLPALLDLIERSKGLDELDRLAAVRGRSVALPVGEGCYVSVAPQRVRTLVQVLLELYQGSPAQSALRFPEILSAALGHLQDALGDELELDDPCAICARARSLTSPPRRDAVAAPAGLQATLRGYQGEGLAWLRRLREHHSGGILADDMGLGKTLQTIAHLLVEHTSGTDATRPSIVVAPTSLVANWQREMRRFAPGLRILVLHGKRRHQLWPRIARCDVVITSYPLLLRDCERLAEYRFCVLVLDEAQALKNCRSQIHRSVRALSAEQRLCLTGTPIENHLGELWALCDIAVPGLLGNEAQFRTVFRGPIERQGSPTRLRALRERVAPYVLRRLKEDVAPELPEKTEFVRPVELGGSQRDLYESIRVAAHAQVRTAIRQKGLCSSTIAILDALMKLRQVCCDPRLVAAASAHRVRESAKFQHFFELLSTQLAQKRRILVFSQFARMLALLAEGLHQRAIPHTVLTGATRDRQRVIDAFIAGRVDVFLISLKAGGTGLNLTRADTVIHYDPWWNPAAQSQATDRAYRIGQTRPVFVYNLIVAGSVEERMVHLQNHKRNLADTLLGSADRQLGLSEDQVETLFAPLGTDRGQISR